MLNALLSFAFGFQYTWTSSVFCLLAGCLYSSSSSSRFILLPSLCACRVFFWWSGRNIFFDTFTVVGCSWWTWRTRWSWWWWSWSLPLSLLLCRFVVSLLGYVVVLLLWCCWCCWCCWRCYCFWWRCWRCSPCWCCRCAVVALLLLWLWLLLLWLWLWSWLWL